MTGVPPPPYPGLSASNPSVHSSVSPPPSYYGPPTILTAPPSYSGLFPVIPADDSGCPHGLEYLIALDHIFIEQEIELLEALFACETENKYRVKNVMGQEIYFAVEKTEFCSRQCLGSRRTFRIKIYDLAHLEVIHLHRPCRCEFCCISLCTQEMEVLSPPTGIILGYVKQEWSLFTPKFTIQNAEREPVLKIMGPWLSCIMCGDVAFQLLALDGVTVVGEIRRRWAGLTHEIFTEAETFGVSFPIDMDVKLKAVVMGACFLIDFVYYEGNEFQR